MLAFRAIIRPQKAETLCLRLVESGLVADLAALEVLGAGGQADGGPGRALWTDERRDLLPKVQVSGVIERANRDALVDLICQICRTGRGGDGKLFFLSLT